MKSAIATCFHMVLFSAACLTTAKGADDSGEIEKLEIQVRENLLKETTIQATPLTNKLLSQCFAAEFYNARMTVPSGQGTMSTESVYAKTPDGLVELDLPRTRAPLPEVLKLVNPAFTIKSEQDAMLLFGGLREIFPNLKIDENSRVMRKEGKWMLITGEVFDHYTGFAVQTDETGKVIAITHSLELMEIPPAGKPVESQ